MEARRVLRLRDFSALDAACADAQPLRSAVHYCLDCLQVHVPASTGDVVRVRDVIAEARPFAADVASLCHDPTPDIPMISGAGKASETHSASGAVTMPNLQYTSAGGRFRVSCVAAPRTVLQLTSPAAEQQPVVRRQQAPLRPVEDRLLLESRSPRASSDRDGMYRTSPSSPSSPYRASWPC
jgi:hypothetical protein